MTLVDRYRAIRRRLNPELQEAAKAAQSARARRDWPAAEQAYRRLLDADPHQAGVQLQFAEVLRELGRDGEAEKAYRAAMNLRANYVHGSIRYGYFLKGAGRRSDALAVFEEVARRNPGHEGARQALIESGARYLLPDGSYGQAAGQRSQARINDNIEESIEELRRWLSVSSYPPEAYGAFRRVYPIQPPPPVSQLSPLTVWIEAEDVSPALLRRTLSSLLDQRDGAWRAVVGEGVAFLDHSIASFSGVDNRISFASDRAPGDGVRSLNPEDPILLISSGTVLDREAVGWMRYALEQAPGRVIVCDHDHYEEHWRHGLARFDPVLLPCPSALEVASPIPGAVLIPADLRMLVDPALSAATASQRRSDALGLATDKGCAAHLPRILSSLPAAHTNVRAQVCSGGAQNARDYSQVEIRVVIPTRDRGDLLSVCMEALLDRATHPDRVQIVILDNRSRETETRELMKGLSRRRNVRVVPADEAFNWPRLNNLGAMNFNSGCLVFANNDVEILSSGWDETLAEILSDERVGVIGAKLLYPDGKLQHGGIALGVDDGRPTHEGVGENRDSAGPSGRWARRRPAAAVTGAFMAVRAGVFHQLGGFDPRLSIAYNDVDFCLKVREAGLAVMFAPELELVHRESSTRGYNNTAQKIAWDDDELRDLYSRWGDQMFLDPSRNPQWSGAAQCVFESFRDLSTNQVVASLMASADDNPWRVERRSESAEV